MKRPPARENTSPGIKEAEAAGRGMCSLAGFFSVGLALVIGASQVVVVSAVRIAEAAGVSEAVVALAVVAIGTSLPKIATCVAAARKGHGALAVGDILGANILNITWVAGASAAVNPLVVDRKAILFMFPSMLVIVLVMLAGLWLRGQMTRRHGAVLLGLYAVYMGAMLWLFPL